MSDVVERLREQARTSGDAVDNPAILTASDCWAILAEIDRLTARVAQLEGVCDQFSASLEATQQERDRLTAERDDAAARLARHQAGAADLENLTQALILAKVDTAHAAGRAERQAEIVAWLREKRDSVAYYRVSFEIGNLLDAIEAGAGAKED